MNQTASPEYLACHELALAYGHYADTWEAEALAGLFTPDGVFDRLGTRFCGREAIAAFIANRSREVWQRHHSGAFGFELAADGRSASGTLELRLERGKRGDDRVLETVHARYHDRYVLSAEGWRFSLREVRLAAAPAS